MSIAVKKRLKLKGFLDEKFDEKDENFGREEKLDNYKILQDSYLIFLKYENVAKN